MEDLMLGIATNCLTAAMILWETKDLQCFPATLAITAAAAFLILSLIHILGRKCFSSKICIKF